MILIDSNIFMYAAGKAHPAKALSASIIRRIARAEIDAVIDAEVLQRYCIATGRCIASPTASVSTTWRVALYRKCCPSQGS